MKKNNKGFTLIELLAIIVILAIIAVITVPIILNIIENSRKGAATDSAYGYKDSINKYYISELSNNKKLMLNDTYEVKANGVLNGNFGVTENVEDRAIPIDGTKPSAGELHYSNNTLQGGCLVIGDYAVIFEGGNATSTTKGDCSNYEFSSEQGGNQQTTNSYSMAEMCPGCVFGLFYMGDQNVGEELLETYQKGCEDPTFEIRDDYSDLLENNYFSGIIMNEDVVDRIFVCGVESGNTFCLEGDSEKTDNNLAIIHHFFPSCNLNQEVESDGGFNCVGNDVGVRIYPNEPGKFNINDALSLCGVDGTRAFCGN